MTTKKSAEPKFVKITLTLSINSIDGPIGQPVAAHSIGNGLAWHDQSLVDPKFSKSEKKYRVTHMASGKKVQDFRLRKQAEQFIREASRLADFTKSEADLFKAISAYEVGQIRRMAQMIEAGTYTPGCSL